MDCQPRTGKGKEVDKKEDVEMTFRIYAGTTWTKAARKNLTFVSTNTFPQITELQCNAYK